MKKITKSLFAFLAFIVCFFVLTNQSVSAAEKIEDENDEYVVINPNSNGKAIHKYDYVQYTNSRDIDIRLIIEDSKLEEYDTMFEVCEKLPGSSLDSSLSKTNCSSYLLDGEDVRFQISGRQDGEKELTINLYSNYTNKTIKDRIIKKITLDTTGPIITITDGEYVYIAQGETYTEKGATCIDDSGINDKECEAITLDNEVNMNKEGYQYIRYRATDFLGNETIAVRKIIVEIEKEKSNSMHYWIGAGIGIAILSAFLFIKVFQNKEKQKRQSSIL